MKTFTVLFISVLTIHVSVAQNYTWTQKASLPGVGRRHSVSFSIGNYGYVSCGVTGNNNINLNDLWEYGPDPTSVSEPASALAFSAYSNPANEDLNIALTGSHLNNA